MSTKREFIKLTDDAAMPERPNKLSSTYNFYANEDIEQKFVPDTILNVHTGIKVNMPADNVLLLTTFLDDFKKKGLSLANGIKVIDKSNSKEIVFPLLVKDLVEIHKGQLIGQGIFTNYLITDNDQPLK